MRSDSAPEPIWPGMPTTLTMPSAHAATIGVKPISIRYLVWCTCTAYQAKQRAEDSRARSTRSARCASRAPASIRSPPRPRSTMFDGRAPCAVRQACDRRRAAGRCPAGRLRTSRLIGTSTSSTSSPIVQHDAAPAVALDDRSAATAAARSRRRRRPEKAMLMASAAAAHEPVRQELRMGGEAHEVGADADQHAERGVELPRLLDHGRRRAGRRVIRHTPLLDHEARAVAVDQPADERAEHRRDQEAEGERAGGQAAVPAELVDERRQQQREGRARRDARSPS